MNDQIRIRPLRNGDTAVIESIFARLGTRSRTLRFGGAKKELTRAELEQLARVDGERHVLVAWVAGTPIGIARLARDPGDRTVADVAYAVVDEWQGDGVGTALMEALAADARAAGIRHLRATMRADNIASLALMKHATTVERTRFVAGELEVLGRAA